MKNNLKIYRKKFNLSQEDLAEKLKISRQTIISIEKEKYNPSIILAFKISSFFKCKIEDIFIYKENINEKL